MFSFCLIIRVPFALCLLDIKGHREHTLFSLPIILRKYLWPFRQLSKSDWSEKTKTKMSKVEIQDLSNDQIRDHHASKKNRF